MRLTEAYMALGIVSEAQTAAAVLGHNFPDSPWYTDAYRLVKAGGFEPTENKGSWISRAFAQHRPSPFAAAPAARAAGAIHSRQMRCPAAGGPSGIRRLPLDSLRRKDRRMLARLSIRDIVLIDRLDIDFAPGLSVLTGETGAGKSILLDAFALALGARGDATLVRQGAEQGQVTAMFELPAEASGARAAGRQRHRGRRAR